MDPTGPHRERHRACNVVGRPEQEADKMKTTTKCKCGRRMSKYANRCRKCDAARRESLLAEARKIVDSGDGRCPTCGSALRRNMSMAGWWQCEQFGAEGFRARADEPSCDFQTFTE